MSISDKSTLRLIARVLDPKDRLRLAVSLLLVLVGTVLEMLSLALVIPVVQTVVSGDRRSDYEWLPSFLVDIEYTTFVQILMLALVLMFLGKNLFLLGSTYFQQRVQFSINNRIVQKLFENYLRQPYEFHLTNSSSVLVRNVQEYSSAVIGAGVVPLLTLVTDVITGLGLLGMLFVIQPLSTVLLLGLFAVSSFLILVLSRTRTRRWGAERIKHRGALMDALLGGFGGVKEIRLFGRDKEVVEAHRTSLHMSARAFYLFGTVQNVPRAIFEVMAVSGVALLVLLATLRDESIQNTTLVIALFGVVAFRMLPSVNRIIQAIQQLSFGRAGIEGAIEGLSLPQQPMSTRNKQSMSDRFQELEVRDLSYTYPNTESPVVKGVNLRIRSGESVGIVGPSGSGKSTLVDLLLGILSPDRGAILVNGHEIGTDRRFWQDRIGYVPQHVFLLDTSIRRNVAFGLSDSEINDHDVETALRIANLWSFVQGLPQGLGTIVGERGVRLSGGQRQRLGIARALYGNPEVIVLDEATSALDSETEKEIVESFREIAHNHTLIVVAHRTSTLAYCSRLLRLDKGRIAQDGSYEEVVGSLAGTTDRGQ